MVAAYRTARFLLARSVLVWLVVAGSTVHPGELEEECCRWNACRERNGAGVQEFEPGWAERDPRGGRFPRPQLSWNFTSGASVCGASPATSWLLCPLLVFPPLGCQRLYLASWLNPVAPVQLGGISCCILSVSKRPILVVFPSSGTRQTWSGHLSPGPGVQVTGQLGNGLPSRGHRKATGVRWGLRGRGCVDGTGWHHHWYIMFSKMFTMLFKA